jgi:hypothetical protein
MHCTENSKQIFPEMKLCGLVPNSYIHVSVRYLYIPTTGPQMQCSKIGGLTVGIYKRINLERDRAVSFLGIFVSIFRYSVRYPFKQSEISLILP